MTVPDKKTSLFFRLNDPLIGQITDEQGFEYFLNATHEAEKLGYWAMFYPDHAMLPNTCSIYECWTLLGALAAMTRKLRIVSIVSPIPLYYPAELARRIASIDHICGGRVIFGAGCGWNPKEFDAYDRSFDPLKIRVEKMVEGLQIMKALWSNERPVTFKGKHYSLRGAELSPKPKQRPHPPVWMGGNSRLVLKAIAEHADAWVPFEQTFTNFKVKIAQLRKFLHARRRDPKELTVALATRMVVSSNRCFVKKKLAGMGINPKTFEYTQSVTGKRHKIMAGTPKECAAQLNEYAEEGANHFVINIQPADRVIEGLRIFAEEVLPETSIV